MMVLFLTTEHAEFAEKAQSDLFYSVSVQTLCSL